MQTITIVLLILTFHQVHAAEFAKFWEALVINGDVIKVNDKIIGVSAYDRFVDIIYLNSDHSTCNITLNEEHRIIVPTKSVTALGNRKIILSYYHHNVSELKPTWLLLLVDPQACTYGAINLPKNQGLKHSPGQVIKVLPYHDTFDVFATPSSCFPCRFNDRAERINFTYSLNSIELPNRYEDFFAPHEIRIGSINETDPSNGYIYLQDLKNCSTLVQMLNDKFQVIDQRRVDYSVGTYSFAHGRLSVCSTNAWCNSFPDKLTCELMDSTLNTKLEVTVNTDNYNADVFLLQSSLRNLPDGGAALSLVSNKKCLNAGNVHETLAEIKVVRIRHDGRIDPAVKAEQIECLTDPRQRIKSFELDGGQFCSVFYDCCSANNLLPFATISVRCTAHTM